MSGIRGRGCRACRARASWRPHDVCVSPTVFDHREYTCCVFSCRRHVPMYVLCFNVRVSVIFPFLNLFLGEGKLYLTGRETERMNRTFSECTQIMVPGARLFRSPADHCIQVRQ